MTRLYFRPCSGLIQETDPGVQLKIEDIRNYRTVSRTTRRRKRGIETKMLGELLTMTSLPKPVRAGVVVFRIDLDGDLELCLGLDNNYQQITNFAGAVEYSIENCLDGAYREFNEETYDIFEGDTSNKKYPNNLVCYDDTNLIIFAETSLCKSVINQLFEIRKKKIERAIIEIRELIWYKIDEFIELLQSSQPIIWDKLQSILLVGCMELRKIYARPTPDSTLDSADDRLVPDLEQ